MRFWICSNFQWFVAQPGWNLRKFQLEQLERSFSTHHLDRYTRCHRSCRLHRCPCLACLACCLQVSGYQLRLKGSQGHFDYHGRHIKGTVAREHPEHCHLSNCSSMFLMPMRYIPWRVTWYQTTAIPYFNIFHWKNDPFCSHATKSHFYLTVVRYILSSQCKTSLTWWSGNLLGSISSLPTVPFSVLAETKEDGSMICETCCCKNLCGDCSLVSWD